MKEPLVSICLITYKHEKYIGQAIDGILMQEVNFPYEIIIADDFSTDQTRKIILDYKNRFPEIIKTIFQIENVGAGRNFVDLINAAEGKYIAYLEGDDFWIDSQKLQVQYDFLEANKDEETYRTCTCYHVCYHVCCC